MDQNKALPTSTTSICIGRTAKWKRQTSYKSNQAPVALLYNHEICPSCELFVLAHINSSPVRWDEQLKLVHKGELQNYRINNNFPMKTRQCFTQAEKELFQLSESEEEDEEDTKEIDEEFNMALKMHRIVRARTRIETEAEENNFEIATFLNRIISKTNKEMKMDFRQRDTEETSVWQISVNREMEIQNEEAGNNLSTDADIVHNYNYPVDQLVEIDSRVEEELSQRANAHRAGNNNGDGGTVENRTSGPVKQRGGDKSSTSDAQQLDKKQNRRDGISEGDGIIVSGKSITTVGRIVGGTSKKCRGDDARSNTISGGAKNKKIQAG